MKNRYIANNKITNEFIEKYTKTTYRIVGNNKHSAIKPCHWLEQRLLTGRDNRNCYKGVFGIQSHRCLQNSPSFAFCNHQCVFCWRDIENGSLGSEFSVEPDEADFLVEEMLRHQRDIVEHHLPLKRYLDNYEIMLDVMNFMLMNKKPQTIDSLSNSIHVSKTKIARAINLLKNQNFIEAIGDNLNNYVLESEIRHCIDSRDELEMLVHRELTTPNEIMEAHSEAKFPNHAAISLDGEPLMYPLMSDLVEEFRKRNLTTFIVTNSTLPENVENLEVLPSQMYFTLAAPNEQVYKKTCRPMIRDGWNKINHTLELVGTLGCRTLLRLTAVKNLNLKEDFIDEYVRLIENANPNFFEIKGFTLQAKALEIADRLKSNENSTYFFPDYAFLEDIAHKFEEKGSFNLIYKNEPSRDFLFAVNWDKNTDPKLKEP